MDEQEKEAFDTAIITARKHLIEALQAKGEQPTERNIVKLAYSMWLCGSGGGAEMATDLIFRMMAVTCNLTGCSPKAFYVDEACEIIGEIFLDLSLEHKKAGITRGKDEEPILGHLLQGLN